MPMCRRITLQSMKISPPISSQRFGRNTPVSPRDTGPDCSNPFHAKRFSTTASLSASFPGPATLAIDRFLSPNAAKVPLSAAFRAFRGSPLRSPPLLHVKSFGLVGAHAPKIMRRQARPIIFQERVLRIIFRHGFKHRSLDQQEPSARVAHLLQVTASPRGAAGWD